MENKLEQQIKILQEENARLQLQVNELKKDKQECIEYWNKAVEANEILLKQLEEARTEWTKCAGNWTSAVNAYAELENNYKALLREETIIRR